MVANLWTVEKLADASGLSGAQVRWLLRQGTIEGDKLGRAWVVTDTEARRWLAERKAGLEQQAEKIDV
jgi:hypothetical protein